MSDKPSREMSIVSAHLTSIGRAYYLSLEFKHKSALELLTDKLAMLRCPEQPGGLPMLRPPVGFEGEQQKTCGSERQDFVWSARGGQFCMTAVPLAA
ncbi:MAG: hypothetical protein HPY59_03085 [Anaerolineae bacterium]|nr:hypothetical protein [Anaerolineae bacterium]